MSKLFRSLLTVDPSFSATILYGKIPTPTQYAPNDDLQIGRHFADGMTIQRQSLVAVGENKLMWFLFQASIIFAVVR